MLNAIWGLAIVLSLVISFFLKTTANITAAIMKGIEEATQLFITLAGIMCFWGGIMKIAEKSNITNKFSKLLSPLFNILFPFIKKEKKAKEAITMSMIANIFGIGNAATAFSLSAMSELDKINKSSKIASDEMCIFTILNVASLQIIPTTIISFREKFSSQNSGEVIPAIWISSLITLIFAIVITKICEKNNKQVKKIRTIEPIGNILDVPKYESAKFKEAI